MHTCHVPDSKLSPEKDYLPTCFHDSLFLAPREQAAPSAPSAPSASTASYAAASVLAASVGAVMARRPVSSFSQTTVTALKALEPGT